MNNNKQLIGDFLKRIKRPMGLEENTEYKLVTIKMNHKGVVLRGLKKGCEIKSKMFEVKQGDFILSGIDARNGAFGIVPAELDGAIVTNDFWYFEIDETVINKELFLELTSTNWFDEICKRGSDGTTQRIRLQKDKFFNQSINLPQPTEQQGLLKKIQTIRADQVILHKQAIDQQAQVKQLKQAILQEAIQGKLTADWRAENPDAEPASELLKRIKAEKQKLIDEKKIRKEKPLPAISAEEILFDLPDGWVWCRLGEVYKFIDYRGKTPKKIQSGIRLLTAKNVRFGYLNIEPQEFISGDEYSERMTRGFPRNGDILFTTEAPLGNACMLQVDDENISTGQRVITFQSPLNDFINDLFLFFITSPPFQYQLNDKSSGVTATGIKASRLKNILLPLPPLPEQTTIVQKVESLLQTCTNLETEIKQSETHATQLIQAVIKEAFESEKASTKP
jgi:type I restriction enzyme, S subunit